MLRNKTKRSATMIGRITALIMVPASASGSVFEFDEEGIVTHKPTINYIQRARMNGSASGPAVNGVAAETKEIAPDFHALEIPSEAISYVALPAPNRAPDRSVRSIDGDAEGSVWRTNAVTIATSEAIPPKLFIALINAESGFDPMAVSPKGAIGLTQLMPGTAKALGVDPHDPLQNLTGGARYLRQQYERFGSWPLALAAYNAGPTRVAKLGRIPNISETKTFVSRVMRAAGLESSTLTTASN